ncbi:hypothetical protein [Flavobacterium sp. FlaQc-48]|uniref:hypothetical protein n=1 Tax=Flavobacterium sp. FlaQc-48 TaxID=3374181 RepID=UPI0037565DF4
MKIVGNNSIFAVEYEVTDKKELMGYARIWFNGEYIGSKKELIYLKSYLLERLKRISEKKILNINNDNIIEKYNLLENRLNDLEDNDIHKYLVSFGTLSDDYTIFSYLTDDDFICVIWKLVGDYPCFDDINYNDRNVKFFKILKKDYLIELEKIEKDIYDSVYPPDNYGFAK